MPQKLALGAEHTGLMKETKIEHTGLVKETKIETKVDVPVPLAKRQRSEASSGSSSKAEDKTIPKFHRPPTSASLLGHVDGSAVDPAARHLVPPSLISNKYSPDELADLRAESEVARQLGLSWQQRGPPVSTTDGTWRGQKWRESSQRFANRGGSKRSWYEGYYRAKRDGPAALATWLANNPKPE
jgi:hypothetical protein